MDNQMDNQRLLIDALSIICVVSWASNHIIDPFQGLYGRLPPLIPFYELDSSLVNEVDKQLVAHDKLLAQLKQNLNAICNKMKQIADRRREVIFQEGDLALKLQWYR